ncbi:MAG: heavy metal translocating P-type ATPase, partial [Firmicutes bacterium]|nr:heavy metal translocating P-type ATPase [Bacillota bacterium]
MKKKLPNLHHDEHCGCHHEHHCAGEHGHCEYEEVPEISVNSRSCDLSGDVKRKIYLLENLGCANCAAKMERKINALPGVAQAEITFATKQLSLLSADAAELLPQIQEICSSIESEVNVVPKERIAKRSENKTSSENEGREEWISLILGVVLFVAALGMSAFELPALPVFVLSYLVLAKDILRDAVKSVTKGHALDENFLMAIASIGAFLIGEYVEAVAVVLFFSIGELFEKHAVAKSRSQIMDAVDMRPETVNLLVKDDIVTIPAEDAVIGDILLVRPGDRIPLDGTIVEGESRVDTSPVTGESVPVSVFVGNEVISGCINVSGVLKLRVEKPLSESMVTRILDSVEQAAAGKPQIDRFITRFARVYTPFVVALAVATAVIPSLITGDWEKWVYTA